MGLDVRLPIGLMFVLLGPILVIEGIRTSTPVNWQSGSLMAGFGVVMLVLGLRGQGRNQAAQKAADQPPSPNDQLH